MTMKDNDAHAPAYEVGKGRPPHEHRFKPGRSGNPAGKKTGTRSARALFLKAAFAKPRQHNRYDLAPNHATQLEAMFARLLDGAAHGDPTATARVLALCNAFLVEEPDGAPAAPDAAEDASADPV
jgi:hypothetical protein